MITKYISKCLKDKCYNWTQREVRLYFNNYKSYYKHVLEPKSFSQLSFKNLFVLPKISIEKEKASDSNYQDVLSENSQIEQDSSILSEKIDEKEENTKVLSMLSSRKLHKEKNENIISNLNKSRFQKNSVEEDSKEIATISTVQSFQNNFSH